MSALTLRSTKLPVEILEQILLHLLGQDVIKMEVVQRLTVVPRFGVDWLISRHTV